MTSAGGAGAGAASGAGAGAAGGLHLAVALPPATMLSGRSVPVECLSDREITDVTMRLTREGERIAR